MSHKVQQVFSFLSVEYILSLISFRPFLSMLNVPVCMHEFLLFLCIPF